jgi:hypothetical protein
MTLSSGKRAWIAVAVLVVILCGCGVAYFYYRGHIAALPASTAKVTAQQVDLLSLLPGDAPVIGFADLAALKTSAFVQEFEKLGPSPAEDADYSAFVRETGFDYTRDLDTVAIAAWPDSSSTQQLAPGGPPVPTLRVLVLGDGRFDAAKIAGYAARSGRRDDGQRQNGVRVSRSGRQGFAVRLAAFAGAHRAGARRQSRRGARWEGSGGEARPRRALARVAGRPDIHRRATGQCAERSVDQFWKFRPTTNLAGRVCGG